MDHKAMSKPAEFESLKIEPINNNSARGVKITNYAVPGNISHINSSNEDENLIKSKREAMLTIITPGISPEIAETYDDSATKIKTRHLRDDFKAFMSSKFVEVLSITFIIIYILLVIANLVMYDPIYVGNDQIATAIQNIRYAEIALLGTFTLEILLKLSAFGFRTYYRSCSSVINTILVFGTLALTIVDMELNSNNFLGAGKLQALFKVFRIFLLVKKSNEFHRITTSKIKTSGFNLKSPVEKIIELLDILKANIKDKSLKSEIDWAIQVIANNRLYDPIFEGTDDKSPDKQGAGVWLKSYARIGVPQKPAEPATQSKLHSRELSRRRSLSNTNINKRQSTFKLPSCSISNEKANFMLESDITNLSFNIFTFKKLCKEDELVHMVSHVFQLNNLYETLNIDTTIFYSFIRKIQSGYHPNPYHNALHAADVVQTVHYFLTTGDYLNKADLNNIEIAAMYLSAAIHDFDHPGSNNAYQISTNSIYALRYNDRAVLENHHISASFAVLQDDQFNIFATFSKPDYKVVRERIISMVLATDMSTHFTDISKLKGRLAADFSIKDKDKNFTMDLIIHAADISNPSKSWEPCREWTNRIAQEFYNQGDMERSKSLPITHLCDKYTVNIGKSQIGFIDFVVSPLFVLMKEILPNIDISNLESNKGRWKDLIEHYDKELVTLNEKKEDDIQKMIG